MLLRIVLCFTLTVYFLAALPPANTVQNKTYTHKQATEEISDMKEFKKILRTKNNVLVCFVNSMKQNSQILKIFREVGETIKGQGTMIIVDCSGDGKKICKNYKVKPQTFVLKHYKDGDFHKDYDRRETVQSMTNFMRDPTGDIPWEEESVTDVVHFQDAEALAKYLKKESKPTMVMFYAPWCGFCKQLKPEYVAAAKDLKGHSILAAIDVNRPENAVLRQQYNITGFPTLLYFENGKLKYNYEGDNKKDAIVKFMKNPKEPPVKQKDVEWSETESDVVHLGESNFHSTLKEHASVLVMFYAPWCGHCKKMKPEYEKAASVMKDKGIPGILAAVDATKHTELGRSHDVRGYPTVKYFKDGELAFDAGNIRTSDAIIEFMRNPKEPPPPPPPEAPWSDEPVGDGNNVFHLKDETFKQFLRKKKHVLVMFYAPWCGHCKKAKPEFKAAAEHFKDDSKVEFAAVDCTVYTALCNTVNVSGYPTIKHFHYYNKEEPLPYSGDRTAKDFIRFIDERRMLSSSNAEPAVQQQPLKSGPLELTKGSFQSTLSSNHVVFVMFYKPGCTNCQELLSEIKDASQELAASGVAGIAVATVNCQQENSLCSQQQLESFPVFQLFKRSKFALNYNGDRSARAFVNFIKKAAMESKDEL
ncbi:protein disulfide-isomerase A5 [Ischnura elegans]|uniref:protein disulfide-isomerase A5 n=1 Tax=Ischnura elegans TaxID=197161 RepID=UPI001ED8AF0C|nr:protein disulfide-isomerase A5 [Ischnura elegans]